MPYAENCVKKNFDNIYLKSTPKDFIHGMSINGYEISEQARPYCEAIVDYLSQHNQQRPSVLDLGCSYGIGSVLIKHRCTLDELVSFMGGRSPDEFYSSIKSTRKWLKATENPRDIHMVGMDSSAPAINYAKKCGLLDQGISINIEENQTLDSKQQEILKTCNFLMCTGAIGYITHRTFAQILSVLGLARTDQTPTTCLLTVLRLFDTTEIFNTFRQHGWHIETINNIRLRQRRYADKREQTRVLKVLAKKGIKIDSDETHAFFSDIILATYMPPSSTTPSPASPTSLLRMHTRKLRNLINKIANKKSSGYVTYIHR